MAKKIAKALVNFIDGSFLFVELGKKIDVNDTILNCSRLVGLPDGTPADKPTIATATFRAYKMTNGVEVHIPYSRINCIVIQEEYIGKDISSDIENLWK